MKKSSDPRHRHRQQLVQKLFSFSFRTDAKPHLSILPITQNLSVIDQHISANAPEWPISQINRVDLAVLRLAIFELSHSNVPQKVVIDEAVELGKEFGSNSSAKFINGVLGNYLKTQEPTKSQ